MGAFRPVGAVMRALLCGWVVLSVGCSSSPGTTSGTGGAQGDAAGGSGGTIGSGTGGSGVGADAGTPSAQCASLVKTICTRFFGQCKLAPDAGADDEATCERQLVVSFGCERAPMSYGSCLSDASLISCGSLFTADGLVLPPTCKAPISATPPSMAQTQCVNLIIADCTRGAQCAGIATPTQADLNNCVLDGIDQVGCSLVTAVGATYPDCLAALMMTPCPTPADGGADGGADAGTPPSIPSCNGVLTTVD